MVTEITWQTIKNVDYRTLVTQLVINNALLLGLLFILNKGEHILHLASTL